MKNSVIYFSILVGLLFNFTSCLKVDDPYSDQEMTLENIVIPEGFNFETTRNVEIHIDAPLELEGVVFSLVNYRQGIDSLTLVKGTFDENGVYESVFSVPSFIDTLLLVSHYVGLITNIAIPITGNVADLDLSAYYNGDRNDEFTSGYSNSNSTLKSAEAVAFSYMGSYNSSGVPSYLTGRDNIARNLLDDINASLPEGTPLTKSHPEYLSGAATNIYLTKNADVWVTFVAEGAGWRNALGYYTYQAGNAPGSVDDISDLKIIFPNTSMNGSGGGLSSGDKVHLGRFNAGTVVSWFLVANGWNGSTVGNGNGVHFSNTYLNSETNSSLKDHMVLLNDKTRSLLLIGFEDVPRNWGMCDNDFNDAVFYATVNPYSAVSQSAVQSIDAANDSDGDGVNDEIDDFPYDPDKTFNNYSPSQGSVGSLAFEDLWPSKGDYDFNDLVVNYSFNMIANSKNKITSIEADFTIVNIGGSFRNGFAFSLPIASNFIDSIENQVLNVGYASVESNGVERDGGNSVIFVAEDTQILKGKTIHLVIHFSPAVNSSNLGGVPYNPFICVNGDRSREVHLPDLAPTGKGGGLLGSKDDYSNSSKGRYYKSNRNLPWGLNIYQGFSAPAEKVSIDHVYPKFVTWANSGGTTNLDWYR
ncbi:MAG: LruC domain-containing protein [Prolixibacteraceae bacterium]